MEDYFKDPKAFRKAQAKTGAIIEDEFARKFCSNRLQHHVEDLHVCVQYQKDKLEKHLHVITEYLEADGWTGEATEVEGITIYQKPGAPANSTHIHLHTTGQQVLVCLLNSAPSTATLNFITWNRAYALFPRTTFVDMECYVRRTCG